MVKLKNVAIPRAFSETDLHKKEYFKEPHGMVDVDLENVLFNKFQMDLSNYKPTKRKKDITLLFLVLLWFILGGLGCFLLTVILLNNPAVTIWYNLNNSSPENSIQATNYQKKDVDEIENTSYSLCNLNKSKRDIGDVEISTVTEDSHDEILDNNPIPKLEEYISRTSELEQIVDFGVQSNDSYSNDSPPASTFYYNDGRNPIVINKGVQDNENEDLIVSSNDDNSHINTNKFHDLVADLFNIDRYNRNITNLYSGNDAEMNINHNKNTSPRMCPTYNSPLGYPVLQQQVSPYVYNSNEASLQSGRLPSQITYSQPFSQVPSYYDNPIVQSSYNKNLKTFNGQTYICHPVSTLNEYNVGDFSLQTTTEDTILQQTLTLENSKNKTRASRTCPLGEFSCEDNSKCIKVHQRCDGEVHCNDASDEAFCPCKTRLLKSRICDGYVDCPNGEDELRCFGCELGTFSCDDWSPRERDSTCIPVEQRCDGIAQCPTEKDELDCSLLIDNFSTNHHFAVSKTIGFLYKNFKGRWYPACDNAELWANQACRSETGPNTIAPLTHLVPLSSNYNGFYASAKESDVKIVESCEDGAATFVECPPLVCGIRIKEQNPFRREEIDISAEEMLGQTDRTNKSIQTNQNESDPILGSGRVVGGKPSQPKAWPWIVSVYRNGVFHCGGALINEYWVVSAAHCVDKYWRYYYEIQAGVLRRYSYAPMVQNRIVSNIIAHQFYDKRKLKNDIALMKISKPVEFNRYVKPICLPSEITAGKNFIWGPEPGTLCTAVGWGAMVEHGTDPDHLREVQVPVHKKCKHQEDEEGKEICAGLREGGKDACQGDSGGPFMCRNPNVPNQWYLAGIVSHGEGCARPNEPGVYTRVSLFLEWIFEHIRADILPTRKPLHNCPGYICKDSNTCLANKRRCDKIVDCLQGDDEISCETNTFTEIFKHAMRHMFLRNEDVDDETNLNSTLTNQLNNTDDLSIKTKTENSTTQSTLVFTADGITQVTENQLLDTNTTDETFSSSQTVDTFGIYETTQSNVSTEEFSVTTPDFQFENDHPDSENTLKPTDDALNATTRSTTVETTTFNVVSTVKPKIVSPFWNYSNIQKTLTKFRCNTILQTIEIDKRCDRKADCEDASDEQNCTCVDYLKYKFPYTLCDGETNCLDTSDEQNCFICNTDEYHCRHSNVCIKNNKRCDNVRDCPLGEDERDCFALTDGRTIKLDEDFRPYINKTGVVTINHNGVWRIFCSNWTNTKANVAADICFYLGFADYNNFLASPFQNTPLKIQYNSTLVHDNVTTNETKIEKCMGLFVKCSNKLDVNHRFHETDFTPSINVETPWNAEIYVEGVYKCTGALLENDWVITASDCFENNFSLHKAYVSVLLGNSKSYIRVVNPHEQVIRVVNFLQVFNTNILLLHLEKKISFTRYVRPMGFDVKSHIVSETEVCLAQGRSTINNKNFVYFKPIRNCTNGNICLKKEKVFLDNCDKNVDQLQSWGGCIVCRSVHGWYPAAVYYETFGGCSFSQELSYISISHWRANILKLINQIPFKVDPPKCEGVRCTLGMCIPNSNVCDGVADCRDGSDELNCLKVRNTCASKTTCNCLKSEIKCKNGKCVPKSTFCDKNNDCGDWSDEPDVCSCTAYLNLAHPEKVCDGTRNCQDRSDEDPNLCKCRFDSFVCKRSQKCVSQDVVCDGVPDCPDGEDEIECLSLITYAGSENTEVQVRTAGIWHQGCFPKYLTTLQLEEICTSIGYSGKSAKRLNPEPYIVRHSERVIMDGFTGIWIRPATESKLLVAMSDGTQPFIQLKSDANCYRLFLHCL